MFIYHITRPEIWGKYDGKPSYQTVSLATEGFIHCSYEHQLPAVLDRYYSDADRVIILKLDTDKLRSKLVEEPSTGGEIYPHVYGRINRSAIVAMEEKVLVR